MDPYTHASEIVNKVRAPQRWAEALEAAATALGVDADTLEKVLLEHVGEFMTPPEGVGGFDAAAIAEKARRNRGGGFTGTSF